MAVEGGSDFIDGTSVEVTVSKQGSMQAIEKGKLVITTGDVYAGRVSLGADLMGGTYTVTVTRPQLGRRHQQRDGRHLGRRRTDDRHHARRSRARATSTC